MTRAKLTLRVLAALVISTSIALGQFDVPPTQGQYQAAASALGNAAAQAAPAAAGSANITINTGRVASCSMWEFLGVDKAAAGMKSAFGVARRIPLVQNFGNTVLHPVARAAQLMPSPPGGAIAAETAAPGAAASNGGDPAAAGGAAGPAGAPPPGAPQLPGAAPPKPAAPGPAALLAKIKGAKAANKVEIAAIKQLQRLDPREYPEIIASLLGKLDDPSEEVRYRALVALNNVAKPKLCTRSRVAADDCSCASCQQNWMRQSLLAQPMVIDRLTDLLLRGSIYSPERISGARVSGAPKEYSNRIRRLALQMLECSLQKPQIDGLRRAVPDQKFYGNNKPESQTQPTPIAQTRKAAAPIRSVSSRKTISPAFTRTKLRNESVRYNELAKRIIGSQTFAANTPDPTHLAIRKAAETYLGAAHANNSTELHESVIAQCYDAIKQCGSDPRARQLQLAFVLLTNSRLRLAIAGKADHVTALSADADAFYQWNPKSTAAKEAAFSVVRYAGAVANQHGPQDARYLTQFAQQARHFADKYPDETEYAVPQLVAAAELCELHGQDATAQACFETLARFSTDELAAKALTSHRQRQPVPELKEASRRRNSDVSSGIVQAVDVHEPQEPARLTQVAYEQIHELPPPMHGGPDYLDSVVPGAHQGYETSDRYAFERTTPTMDSFIAAMKAIDASHQFEEVEGDCCLNEGFRNIATARSEGALFALEAARPANVFRIRFDSAKDFASPDRGEFFWPQIGGDGPALPERSVDYQELRLYSEKSIGASSAFVEIPFRLLDPEVNANTAGLGDISLGAKTILLEGDDYLVSTIVRSTFNSGLDRRGLGRGHFVLEPGVLANYRLGCNTWLHGEMKFLIPLGANADAAGEVITFGTGLTHVLLAQPYHSGDGWNLGAIASLEFQGISLLDGQGTLADGTIRETDETLLYLHPGIRFMLGEQFDVGFSAAVPVTGPTLYDRLFRTEVRFSF